MFRRPLVAPSNECADRCRRGIEDVDPIVFDDFPEPIWLWPIRCALVHDNRSAVRERTIDNVTMTGYPADVRGAPENIFVAKIEDIFGGRINAHQITTGRVQNSFWFSGRPACVKKVKRVLAV